MTIEAWLAEFGGFLPDMDDIKVPELIPLHQNESN
jgi:hypothetical protein